MGLRLQGLSRRDIAIAAVAATLLAAPLWWFAMYRPLQARIAELKAGVATLASTIAVGEAAERSLPAFEEEVGRLEAERLEFLAELPHEAEVAELIVQLQDAATAAGVSLETFHRSGAGGEDIAGARPITFKLSVRGRYFDLIGFLQEVEALRRFTLINQVGLALSVADSADPELTSTIAFTSFVFVGEDPGEE